MKSAAKADGSAPVVPEKIVPNVDQKLGVVNTSTAIGKATTVL